MFKWQKENKKCLERVSREFILPNMLEWNDEGDNEWNLETNTNTIHEPCWQAAPSMSSMLSVKGTWPPDDLL